MIRKRTTKKGKREITADTVILVHHRDPCGYNGQPENKFAITVYGKVLERAEELVNTGMENVKFYDPKLEKEIYAN